MHSSRRAKANPEQALLRLPGAVTDRVLPPDAAKRGRPSKRMHRMPDGTAPRVESGSATPQALAAATLGLCHPLRGSGPRRKGVSVIRHCLPFWRDDAATLEAFVELWIGGDE